MRFRSVVYDLAVPPEFQNKGTGTELAQRRVNVCESSEWLAQTDKCKAFYGATGFQRSEDDFQTIPRELY